MKHRWKKTIRVGKYLVGSGQPCFIIAEGGINHNGKMGHAKRLIDAAINANANAIKFQTFLIDRIVSKWLSPQTYKIIKKYELSADEFEELHDYSKSNGIIFSSTPFDISSCDLLAKLHVPFYKIGSGDLDNIPLIIHASKKKKPIFLSTGMSKNKEITEALDSIHPFTNEVVLLHCTSLYPARYDEVNLNIIPTLQKNFQIPIGYSDHTLGNEVSVAAICFGACVVEKHLTLDNKMEGPDHKTSLNPIDFKEMVKAIRNIEESFGSSLKKVLPREQTTRNLARRSIITVRDIPRGKIIDNGDIDILRPSGGIKPKYLNKVLGKKAKTRIPRGKMLKWQMLS